MYRQCSSYSDQSACVADLAATCEHILVPHAYSNHDARWVALNNIATIAKGNQLILNLLDSWSRGDESVRQAIPQLLGIHPVTAHSVKAAGDWINGNSRLSFVLLCQFQIENLVRNICRELSLVVGAGFYNVAHTLLDHLGLSADVDTMNVPALLRNFLHSNGIHHGYKRASTVVTACGVTYTFSHGHRVECATWEHIAHALECSVLALERVLDHRAIRAIADPMMDVYAWEVLTAPSG